MATDILKSLVSKKGTFFANFGQITPTDTKNTLNKRPSNTRLPNKVSYKTFKRTLWNCSVKIHSTRPRNLRLGAQLLGTMLPYVVQRKLIEHLAWREKVIFASLLNFDDLLEGMGIL